MATLKPALLGATGLIVWIFIGDAIYERFQVRLATCIEIKRQEENIRGNEDYGSFKNFEIYYESCRTRLRLNADEWPKEIWLKILATPGYVINR